tara:strand:+ start:68 stop:574 length:507 start_codon:yes stop_codon:yes gene_type:complete
MNNVIKYNTYILNFIIVSVLIILILFLGYKIWKRHLNFKLNIKFGFSKNNDKEDFSQISLEKRVGLYDDYRNFLQGKQILNQYCASNKRMIPYKIAPNCFNDKYLECMNEKKVSTPKYTDYSLYNGYLDDNYFNIEHDKYYENGFKIASRECQEQSYDMCLNDNLNFL